MTMPEIIRRLMIGLIAVGSLGRLLLCLYYNPLNQLFSDPKWHWESGLHLFHPNLVEAGDPILYQVYLYLVRTACRDNPVVVALGNGCLSVVMPWLFYRAAREQGLGKDPALAAWALIVWMPSLWVIYRYMMPETLLLPLMGLSLWLTARVLRKKDLPAWLGAASAWILAIFTKSAILPLAAVSLAYVWLACGLNLYWAAGAVGLFVLATIPNGVRTRAALGYWAPLGNPWIVRIQQRSGARSIEVHRGKETCAFTSPSLAYRPLEPLSPWVVRRALEPTKVVVYVDSTYGERDWRLAYRNLNVGYEEWWRQEWENIVSFFFMPSWPDSDMNSWNGRLNNALRWLWAPLIFYLLDCNIREFGKRHFHLLPLVTTLFLLFLIFQNIAPMEGRYRKPVEPLLLLNLVWALGLSRPANLAVGAGAKVQTSLTQVHG